MQRLAERCNARTPFDLLAAMLELWRALERVIDWEKAITEVLDGGNDIPLRRGGKAVCERRGNSALVVTTVLDGHWLRLKAIIADVSERVGNSALLEGGAEIRVHPDLAVELAKPENAAPARVLEEMRAGTAGASAADSRNVR